MLGTGEERDAATPSTSVAAPNGRPSGWLLPLLGLPAALPLLVLPGSYDGFADVKLLATAAATACAVWWAATAAGRRGRRFRAGEWSALAFLAVAALATVRSDAPALSVLGMDQRANGLLAYAVATALLLVVATRVPRAALPVLAKGLALGAAAAVALWLAQFAGFDPLALRPPADEYATANPLHSTIGNPNFAGAFVAATLPAALWVATRPRIRRRVRLAWLATAALLVAGVAGSAALQAPLAGAAGLGVAGVAALAPRSRRAAAAVLLIGALAAGVAALGLAQSGPLAALGRQDTLVSRTWDWTAAARIVRTEPLDGVGLGRFAGYVRAHRPPDEIAAFGWLTQADAAHSVPLDMAVGGGLPLLAAHVAFVGAVGLRLLRGLLRRESEQLALLGAFGGAWTAYQVQSLVSIDMSILIGLHYLSAGAILALTAAPVPAPGGRRPVLPARLRPTAHVALAALLVAALTPPSLVVAAGWWMGRWSTIPDSEPAALRAAERAIALVPWQPGHWAAAGQTLRARGEHERALAAYLRAVRGDPRDLTYLLAAADLAGRTHRPALAWSLSRQALRVEPRAAEVKVAAARSALAVGRRAQALDLLDAALAFDPGNAEAAELRGRLRNEQPR